MALLDVRFWGAALRKAASMLVLLPKPAENGGAARYGVLYLLHGLSDDHTIWARRSRIE